MRGEAEKGGRKQEGVRSPLTKMVSGNNNALKQDERPLWSPMISRVEWTLEHQKPLCEGRHTSVITEVRRATRKK